MRLSDVLGHAGLAGYAEVAMVLFLAAFVAIVIHLFLPSARPEMERMRRLPLDEDTPDPRPGAPR